MTTFPGLLRPYCEAEAMTIGEMADEIQRCAASARIWCREHHLGRRIGGQWRASRVAVRLFVAGNEEALAAYLAGDRDHAEVVAAFDELGIPLPHVRSREGGGA